MTRKSIYITFILIFIAVFTFCGNTTDGNFFSLSFTPGIYIPLSESSKLFTTGGGADLVGDFNLFPYLDVNAVFNYNFIPIKDNNDLSLNILALGGGGTVNFEVLDNLDMGVNSKIGYYLAVINGENAPPAGSNPFISGGLNLSYRLFPSLSLGLDVTYRNFLGLYDDARVMISSTYHFLPKESGELPTNLKTIGEDLELTQIEFNIFPVLFKYYDTVPVGKLIVKNNGNKTIKDIRIKLLAKEYMDNPKIYEAGFELKWNEKKELPLYALFNSDVLNITEGTKVSCTITFEYKSGDGEYTQEFVKTMEFYNRNAITWDDDRKAAAFVTSKDPTILRFSKNMVGLMKGQATKAINNNLLTALGIHEALHLYGISYVEDPSTPYAKYSQNEMFVDFLQFPHQTLQYKAGDCDDLSILYCALLESVGVETAFITVPGHIYMAFSLDMTPKQARRQFQHIDDLIFRDETTWLPVEITSIDEGFLKAWRLGAKTWHEYNAKEKAGFFPMKESWKDFTPVGYNTTAENIPLPDNKKFINNYNLGVKSFVNYEIYNKVTELQEEIKKNKNAYNLINKLGTLYAKYGLLKEAEGQFTIILKKEEYVPALINMGNIYYLQKNYKKATDFYDRARKNAPDNPVVLLSVARINHELEKYDESKEAFGELKKLEPDLAKEFAYLELEGSDVGRASGTSSPEQLVVWEEED